MKNFTFRDGRRNSIKAVSAANRAYPPLRAAIDPLETRRLLSGNVFTVNSAADDPSGPTPNVVTLRDAVNAVNNDATDSSGSPDVIKFSIAGMPTINLLANLPAITNPVSIDGSTQAGVTVNGNGLGTLVDDSNATVNDLSFTGTVTVGSDAVLTVGTGTVSVTGALDAGDSATLNNFGTLSVSGNLVDAGSIAVYNAQFSSPPTRYAASFTVSGSFTANGDDSFIYNNGVANFSVAKNFTLGDGGSVSNGFLDSDAATFTAGSFSIGAGGNVYNYGDSSLNVTGGFALGDNGYLYNGNYSTDAAMLTVGGNFGIGANGYVDNEGTSSINVTGGFALGNNGDLYNGVYSTDAATFTVGGNFSIGNSSAAASDSGAVYSLALSTLTVAGNFTLYGNGGSSVYNGQGPADAAALTIGGSFSLGANSDVYAYGTKAFSVANGFTLGANSYFDDSGILSVSGNFDPGTGNSSDPDTVSGVLNAAPGSNVTTDSATWQVLAGGQVNVGPGAAFDVASGGSLTDGGTVAVLAGGVTTDQGAFTVSGSLISAQLSTIVVDYNGQLSTQGSGQSNIQGTLLTWNDPAANIAYGTTLSATQLDASANVPGTFSYTLADGVTPAAGAVLPAGNGQTLNVTFTPYNTAVYSSAAGAVLINVVKATPVITWNNPGAMAYFTPLGSSQLNATANVHGTFVYTPGAGMLLAAGVQTLSATFTPADLTDYTTATATTQVVVLGAGGVSVIGSQLYCVGGSTSGNSEQIQVSPIGSSNTGNTGVKVQTSLNGVNTQTIYSQSLTTVNIFLQGGNENVQLANSLTLNTVITAGNGTDNIQLGNGNNVITLGNGNDNIQTGNGTNTIVAGIGNDNVHLGNGSYDSVTLGAGNDNVQIGIGNNETVTVGNGNDNIQIANGGNSSYDAVTIGTGNDGVQIGNGGSNSSFNIVFLPAAGNPQAHIQFGTGTNNTI